MTDPFTDYQPDLAVNATSWFKRLKFWLIRGGVLLLVLFFAVLFFWYRYLVADDLIDLVPVDSVFYLTARNSFWPGQTNIGTTPVAQIFSEFNELLPSTVRASYALVPDQAGNLQPVYFFKTYRFSNFDFWLNNFSDYYQKKNRLVVASNQEILDKIREVADDQFFSLSAFMVDRRPARQLISAYLSRVNLKNYLQQPDNLFDQLVSGLVTNNIYLTMNQTGGKWYFKISSDLATDRSARRLVEQLPDNFKLFISGVNLFEVFKQWGELDSTLAAIFNQTVGSLEAIYDFNLTSVSELLNQPAELLIFDSNKQNIFGFDYILALPFTDESQLTSLKELITIVLAQKFPQVVVRTLADGSTVKELVAQPQVWQWQAAEIADGLTINRLNEPRLDLELGYLVKDNLILLTNSTERLQQYLTGRATPLAELIDCNFNWQVGSLMIVNQGQEWFGYNPGGRIIMSQVKPDEVLGCLSH